jgi:RND superfamily putative drug exporter
MEHVGLSSLLDLKGLVVSRLALFCARWRFAVVGAWVAVLVALAGSVLVAGTAFTDVSDLPDGEAARAYALLDQASGDSGPATERGTIVWRTDDAAVDSAHVREQVNGWLDEVAGTEGVVAVVSPYTDQGAAQINVVENTAYATVAVSDDADTEQIRENIEDLAKDATVSTEVGMGGQAFIEQPGASGGTEAVGLLAALVILLAVFRSGWAASLTILTGVVGVGASMLLIVLATHLVDLSATSITMAALIGLGVGIDYALFIVNRFRNGLTGGLSVPKAVSQAIDTSGRAVVFAGLTVAVALLAMRIVGLGILTGMAQAAAVSVICTVITAVTLLPAVLTILGTRVLSRSQRKNLAAQTTAPSVPAAQEPRPLAARWARAVTSRPGISALIAVGVIVVLALPMASMRVGNSDASSDPAGSPGREYTELMAPAFGDGVDATLVLVAETPDQSSREAFGRLVTTLDGTENVAAVNAAPIQPGQVVSVASVTPTTSAQTEETQALVETLRDETIPPAEKGTNLNVLVGGETATNIDIGDALMSKLPLYLAVVALLGFLLLVIAFRSILVPLVGALTNIGTLLVGLGAITAIFQFGWGSELLGVGTGAPVMYIVPVIIVGVMFGLSMDYQVFLVSRMHEEYHHTKDNLRSIKVGLTETAKVIGTAATIMLAVFASFGFSGERIVSAIGIGLAVAVVVDAFIVRMILVPALMRLIGDWNWAYPTWLERFTPHLSIEGPTMDDDTTAALDVTDGGTDRVLTDAGR